MRCTAAALGVGALIVASQPLFDTVGWAGVAYLCRLAVHALRSARRGPENAPGSAPKEQERPGR